MGSYDYGKQKVVAWISGSFPLESSILDVGAGDGKWRQLLREYPNMDAVEAYGPNLQRLNGYRKVFHADIRDFRFDRYDLIIFGDVLEHLRVKEAQAVLDYARPRCRDMVISVPFLYEQGAIYGNPYEVHIQDDLTPALFEERYPGFEVLCDPGHDYRYYHKGGGL